MLPSIPTWLNPPLRYSSPHHNVVTDPCTLAAHFPALTLALAFLVTNADFFRHANFVLKKLDKVEGKNRGGYLGKDYKACVGSLEDGSSHRLHFPVEVTEIFTNFHDNSPLRANMDYN